MHDFQIMQRPESSHDLDEDAPHVVFVKESVALLVLHDLLEEVAVVCELHDNAMCIVWNQQKR